MSNRTLRTVFNQDATLYDRARPGYPREMFEDIITLSEVPSGGRILEIGCGTGQATLPMARRGYDILCIELGENLASIAKQKLAPYPKVKVMVSSFEDWPIETTAFDLVLAATSFHWLDPEAKYAKSAQALKPGGAIAIASSLHVEGNEAGGFFEEVQLVYEREAPELTKGYEKLRRPEEVPDQSEEIASSGLFHPATSRRYVWNLEYDAESYIAVLNTYSGHRNLDLENRANLFRGIADLIDSKYGGRITKTYVTTLCVARKP